MTDIFREVEEEVRRERYEKLWKQYGDYIIAGAALVIISVAAFQLWRVYQQRRDATASQTYSNAEQVLAMGQAGEASEAFAKLAQTAPSGYARLSQLEQANALYASGNVPEAVELYKAVAAKGDPVLASIARIRAAWATVETAPLSETQALLQPLTDGANPWHPVAREILAYADYRAGNTKAAYAAYRSIAAEHDAPKGVRMRSEAMATFLGGGGDKDFGTVPADKTAPSSITQNPTAPAGGPKPQ